MLNISQKTINLWVDGTQRLSGEIFKIDNIVLGGFVLLVAVFIQLFFPPGTRTISRRTWMENFENILKINFWIPFVSMIYSRNLKEYRCPTCNKLLAKGSLKHKDDVLEVKCRGCSGVYLFKGENAEIIEKRSDLPEEELIPNPKIS